ncbi:hypothetical protein, partial [Roseateles sp.]|uniref:hypothetical protein n=1 Tax=Roseateles sp. TaxID=1971397 RepID=UPI003BA4976D
IQSALRGLAGQFSVGINNQALLASSEQQAATYTGFLDRIAQIESALANVVKTAGMTNQASGEVMTRLAGLAADSVALRETIRTSVLEVATQNAALGDAVRVSVGEVASKLEGQSLLAIGLRTKVDGHAKRIEVDSDEIVQALRGHAAQVAASQAPIEALVNANHELCQQLQSVASSNTELLDGTRKRLEGFERAACSAVREHRRQPSSNSSSTQSPRRVSTGWIRPSIRLRSKRKHWLTCRKLVDQSTFRCTYRSASRGG